MARAATRPTRSASKSSPTRRKPSSAAASKPRGRLRRMLRWRVLFVPLIVGGLCVYFFDLSTVESPAMMPGIERGDLVLVDRTGAFDPDGGDVILVRNPDDRERELMVRVVAVEDDTVELAGDGALRVNGEAILASDPVERWQAAVPADEELSRALASGARELPAVLPDGTSHRVLVRGDSLARRQRASRLEIPRDHVYVVGDNRDAAYDSRAFGPVPLADVVGRVRLIVRTDRDDGGLVGRWLRLP